MVKGGESVRRTGGPARKKKGVATNHEQLLCDLTGSPPTAIRPVSADRKTAPTGNQSAENEPEPGKEARRVGGRKKSARFSHQKN